METYKHTPLQLFNLPQHFIIPLFQRAYVWDREHQWELLWQDIRRTIEQRLQDPRGSAIHFLGAIVLQANQAGSNRLTSWNVIDGQQRLTTLQLVMDAAAAVLAERGYTRPAEQLEALTHNSETYVEPGENRLKVVHLNKDRRPFVEVMDAEAPIDYSGLSNAGSRVVEAHQYFSSAVEQWVDEPVDHETNTGQRADALADVLQTGLQLVSIELSAEENSQEIFETLNARGTPLTAADLIRNFVFQQLEREGSDTRDAYQNQWPFEARFWNQQAGTGRQRMSRSSLFFNQWLTAELGEEISTQTTFARFKEYAERHSDIKMADLLPRIRSQADRYQHWTEAAERSDGDLSAVEAAVYRMDASGIELLKPLLVWLHAPGRDIPEEERTKAIRAAESWVYRRQLLRLTGADLGRVVADLIRALVAAPAGQQGARVSSYLARLNAASTYWPGDDEIRAALRTEFVYRRYPRGRLRMFLETIENSLRAETNEQQVTRGTLPIEHIMPQTWEQNWPVSTTEQADNRRDHIHRLGNLTLLTTALNSKVSNSGWDSKRAALVQHSTILMNAQLITMSKWGEMSIDTRTDRMVTALLRAWPVPEGHKGEVIDPQAKGAEVQLHHLIDAGLISPGTVLSGTAAGSIDARAVVTDNGHLKVDGRVYETPSGAAAAAGKNTNGWYFWALPDGRRLRDLRVELYAASLTRVGPPAGAESTADVSSSALVVRPKSGMTT